MFESVYNERRRWHLLAAAFGFFSILAQAQPFVPGQTYFGRSNYMEYIAGNLPIIISAPHGGSLAPAEMPNRTNATTVNDGNTQDLVRKVRTEIQNLTGHVPHIIINRLDRDKIDCNREIVEGAQGNPEVEIAWHEFQNFIIAARTNTVARHGHGFYIDLHGHGHDIQRLELGYLLSSGELGLSDGTLNSAFYENQSSIRTLSQQSPLTFPTLLRGSNSFGALIVAEGYLAVPSPSDPDPDADPYFNGGYNTIEHGSMNGGTISGLQIESNSEVRATDASRTAYAQAIASVLEKYFALHYNVSLRESVPSVWDVGSGSWNTSGSWADGALPVSTNHIIFLGGGGNSTHNRSALTTGTGVLASLSFSNSVSGAYTLSGNAFSVLRGIANNSAFPHFINNHVTLVGSQTVAAASGALTFGGNLTNGTLIRCLGDVTVNGVITGAGGLIKSGPGTLDLNAVNSYSGPTTNSAGIISVNSASTFGNANGLLVLAGGDILAENTRSGAPIANPLLLTGSSTISGDGTLTNSLRILPFSTDSISTVGGTLTIRHTGANAFASNNVFRVRLNGGGFNFTRPITVGFISDLPSTFSQLESYNDNVSGDQVFSGTISGTGQLRRDAASPAAAGRTILTSANAYGGGTLVNAGTLLVNNFFGSGTGSGLVTVSNNGTLGGTGIISGTVWCAGAIAPGQSAGTLTLGGGMDMSAGGTNVWELSTLTTVGEGSNFDQLLLNGGNLALGGSSKLQLSFIGAASAPNASEPFWLTSHFWKIISLVGGAGNPGSTRFSSILNGNYATGSFTNFADGAGNIILAYVAVPAPAPTIQSITASGVSQFALAIGTATNRTYVLQYTTNLSVPVWMDVSTNIAPENLLTLTNATSGDPMGFYRVRVVP